MAKEAEEKRKQLQAEGKRAAILKIESEEASIRKELDQRLADAAAQVERKKKALLAEGERKAASLREAAKKRMPTAKEFVLSEFERAVDA